MPVVAGLQLRQPHPLEQVVRTQQLELRPLWVHPLLAQGLDIKSHSQRSKVEQLAPGCPRRGTFAPEPSLPFTDIYSQHQNPLGFTIGQPDWSARRTITAIAPLGC